MPKHQLSNTIVISRFCPFGQILGGDCSYDILPVKFRIVSVIKRSAKAASPSGIRLCSETARAEHKLMGCKLILRAENIAVDNDNLSV